ncbi:MAG: hypothetical protein CM15mP30_2170 [Pelagibacteraceae bacterium]|nr:MAG: hypothetical protein CM15mP30_2170 [Pelagibacteraceae bacterium]
MSDYFKDIPTIKYEGRDSTNPLIHLNFMMLIKKF